MITSIPAAVRPTHRSRRWVRRRQSRALRVAGATLAATAVALIGPAGPARAADHIIIGASGDVSGLETNIGTPVARHLYGKLSGTPKVGQLVNIETTVGWSQVAAGRQDANIKRWATALKGKNVMVSFSHEPMSGQNSHWGSASSFVAAWRRVVNVFDQQGSTSVRWVWHVTSDSFRVDPSNVQYGEKWYPGDSYVDYVGGGAYNKVGCGQSDMSFAAKIKDILEFAGQHGKKFVAAEFASNAYSGRAKWISDAHAFMDAHRSQFAGAFYYNPTNAKCNWHLGSSSEFSAFRTMVTDTGFGI